MIGGKALFIIVEPPSESMAEAAVDEGRNETAASLVACMEAGSGAGGSEAPWWKAWGWAAWVALALGDKDKDKECGKDKLAEWCGPFYLEGACSRSARLPFLRAALTGFALGIAGEDSLLCQRTELKVCREMEYIHVFKEEGGVSDEEVAHARARKVALLVNEAVKNGSGLLPMLRAHAQAHFTRPLGTPRVNLKEML